MKLTNENLYAWREMSESSPSNQMEKLMNEVKEKFKVSLKPLFPPFNPFSIVILGLL